MMKLAWLSVLFQLLFFASSKAQGQEPHIHMVVFRGCEEACQGFKTYFEQRQSPVRITVTDIARDRDLLPGIGDRLRDEQPDLVVTWGTAVTQGLLGRRSELGDATALGSIPAMFMIVADPVGADIIESYETISRRAVFGVRNRVPEDVQLRIMFEYFKPSKLGIVNNLAEVNSVLNTERIKALAPELQVELVVVNYALDNDQNPNVNEIPALLAQLKSAGAEAIYVGSNSFNLQHREAFTHAAVELGLPVFSAYKQMISDGQGLMAVASSYSNVGRLAARQASRFLFEGISPEALSIAQLDRYSVFINMSTAQSLGLYPTIQLVGLAEIVQ